MYFSPWNELQPSAFAGSYPKFSWYFAEIPRIFSPGRASSLTQQSSAKTLKVLGIFQKILGKCSKKFSEFSKKFQENFRHLGI
jgi:hypothetical protein